MIQKYVQLFWNDHIPFDHLTSTSNDDENKPSNVKDVAQGAVIDKTVQQMTHGFVALFEKELDLVQYSLKEALYVY